MPPALTSKGLWTVCAPYGRLVDAFIANKLSKGDSILLVKLKDINSMSNMYTICRNEGFSYLNIHHVGGYWIWIQFPSSIACSKFQGNESLKRLYLVEKEDSSALSSGRVCISSKSHHLISENVQVEINKELFEATVQEIGSWSIKINDDYFDTLYNDIIKELDISSESIDDHTVDDLEHIQANLNNIDNQDFDQKIDLNEDKKTRKLEKLSGGLLYGEYLRSSRPGLVDLPLGGRSFTWMNKAGTKLSKLDRFLISKNVIDFLLDIRITALDRIWSDHNPILLHVEKIDFGLSPFKLYNSWLLRDGFDDLIKSEWDLLDSNNTGFPIKCHDKFKILKSKIQKWNNNNKSMDRNRKTTTIEELSSIDKKIEANKFQAQESQVLYPNLPHSHSLNTTDRDYLERLVTLEEIKEAVWDCGSSKAPGPDGFSFAFVKKYWDIIQKDMFDFINSFFVSTEMPHGANSSFFTLIPKVNNHTLITDFPFIAGRQVLDGPIILSEIIEWHKKRNKQLLIFKVDFEKAFDSISWKYLDHILDSLGFGYTWRSWIKSCISSSRASILVNGSLTSEFSINRGLRQGDPLSLFVFILVMEGLHNAFIKAVGNGLISGININNFNINISHLFFADDVIITTGWNARDLENIIRVIHVFYLASRLKINIHISNIYGIGVNEEEVYNMASSAGCIAGNIPFNYLGLPIGSNMKSTASWNFLVDRFCSRLSTWKANLLSIGGRLNLIKSVLGSLGIYYLLIFRAPELVLNVLERIRSNFFGEGGLNIGSLKAFNLALLQNGAGECSLLQMIFGSRSLKLFMAMKVVSIITDVASRVFGLTLLDLQTSFTRKVSFCLTLFILKLVVGLVYNFGRISG
uniref:RNA-directed DNA polymerase, eukaryota, reverse transcriptase zinc-binding domain protein n=1 Tax=Tanacetum cinerariifolium TaxID=118510 RepID=A0A699HA82_TANCI|nr:RNA-directed DNA polymerase, eukaryota, reverse transcriptase zinc-binding domain protein [Tanacetum cinerariifolium]